MGSFLLLLAMGTMSAAATTDAPFFQHELIFPPQPQHVHSSSIIECPNGDFLCAWFQGSGERKSADVVIRGARLKKNTTTWSEPFLLADTPEFPDCNPVLFIDAQQELWLFWIAVLAESWEDSLLRCRKAKDYQNDGPPQWYWQDTLVLKPGNEFADTLEQTYKNLIPTMPGLEADFGAYTIPPAQQLIDAARDPSKTQRGWMTRTHLLTLPSGRIVLPLYSDGFYVGLAALSDDQGTSWRPSAPIPGALLNQPTIVRKKDGTLIAYMREEGDLKHRVLKSQSTDDGETWSIATYTDILNPNASLEVIALQDGRWVMAYNDSESDRNTLALSLSDDEGNSWKWTRHLEQKPAGNFHYPSLIQSRNGHIHITYTHSIKDGKSIKHVELDPEWILQEEASPAHP
ncbi:MAG TPA: exo-alpha-sialidase [Candidatus Hydrogenedentes bacterium]|nr:exo-alpha-sialidase [Candidatus Hydrogenedentota bacterium]